LFLAFKNNIDLFTDNYFFTLDKNKSFTETVREVFSLVLYNGYIIITMPNLTLDLFIYENIKPAFIGFDEGVRLTNTKYTPIEYYYMLDNGRPSIVLTSND
jgi:hypothetical protein